uniref:Major facilitator superfamily (MFS) profile domain-containing protein n=1 Tax=Timema shepardi TaxID=629360 RepID=A0A7R9FWD8_TIMSH|nr:unnamed protein product [Timema shepardi]
MFLPERLISAMFLPERLISAMFLPERLISAMFLPERLISAKFLPERLISAKFLPESIISALFVPASSFGIRHVQAILLFGCLTVAYTLRVNLSVAIVSMTDRNGSNPNFEEYDWNTQTRSTILSSFFWGYVVMQVPAGMLGQRFGPKLFLMGAMAVCSIFNMLTPLAAKWGGWGLVCACRIIQGVHVTLVALFQAFVFPSTHNILPMWSTPEERGRFATWVYAGSQFGTILAMPICGALAQSAAGWPSVFYLFGGLGLLWCVAWFFLAADSPASHKWISQEEKLYIEASLAKITTSDKVRQDKRHIRRDKGGQEAHYTWVTLDKRDGARVTLDKGDGARVTLDKGDGARVTLDKGDGARVTLDKGDGARVTLDKGDGARVTLDKGDGARVTLDKGDGARVTLDKGDGARVTLDKGDGARVTLDKGDGARVTLDKGDGARVTLDKGDGARVTLDKGDGARVTLDKGDGARVTLDKGDGARVTLDKGDGARVTLDKGDGARVTLDKGDGARVTLD